MSIQYIGISLLLFLVFIIFSTRIHENLHVWKAHQLGYKAKANIKEHYADFFGEKIEKQDFIKIALAPFLYQGLLILTYCIIFHHNTVTSIVLIVLHINGCTSDLYLAIRAIKSPSSTIFQHVSTGEFIVHLPNDNNTNS
jgi:hypothetical protein